MASPPLPRGWTEHVKSALLHAIPLATLVLTVARSRGTGDRAQLERAINEIALLKEELGIKGARWLRSGSATPVEAGNWAKTTIVEQTFAGASPPA